MRRTLVLFVVACVALACVCVLLLQPLRLVSTDSTRLSVHVGKTVPLYAVAEMAGGYRCYVNDDEYFWLSTADCIQEIGEPLRAVFHLRGPVTIYRGEV